METAEYRRVKSLLARSEPRDFQCGGAAGEPRARRSSWQTRSNLGSLWCRGLCSVPPRHNYSQSVWLTTTISPHSLRLHKTPQTTLDHSQLCWPVLSPAWWWWSQPGGRAGNHGFFVASKCEHPGPAPQLSTALHSSTARNIITNITTTRELPSHSPAPIFFLSSLVIGGVGWGDWRTVRVNTRNIKSSTSGSTGHLLLLSGSGREREGGRGSGVGFNTQGWSSAPSLPPAFYRNLISSSVLINSAPDFTLPSCSVTPRADFMSAGRGQAEVRRRISRPITSYTFF